MNGGQRLPVTVSVGEGSASGAHAGLEHLLRATDQALYAAKRKGRNRARVLSAANVRG